MDMSMSEFLELASPEYLREIAKKKEERKNNARPYVEENKYGIEFCQRRLRSLSGDDYLLAEETLEKLKKNKMTTTDQGAQAPSRPG